jgi:hypothetical protein
MSNVFSTVPFTSINAPRNIDEANHVTRNRLPLNAICGCVPGTVTSIAAMSNVFDIDPSRAISRPRNTFADVQTTR